MTNIDDRKGPRTCCSFYSVCCLCITCVVRMSPEYVRNRQRSVVVGSWSIFHTRLRVCVSISFHSFSLSDMLQMVTMVLEYTNAKSCPVTLNCCENSVSFLHRATVFFRVFLDPPAELTDLRPVAVGARDIRTSCGFVGELLLWWTTVQRCLKQVNHRRACSNAYAHTNSPCDVCTHTCVTNENIFC